ncbi:MAG: sugar ABC transporter permease [Lachnospiraceae bacterium]|nr:sugar ABC transporter permease [Lachnospiraceae bacterium]
MQKDRKRKKQISEGKAGYLFAAPGILGFLIFTAGPMLISLYYSFTEFSVLTKPKWNGLQNYITMLTSPSSLFLKSLSVTLIYAGLNAVLTMIFSIAVALLLNRSFRGRGILRALYFLPSVIPIVASTVVWNWILDYRNGLMNQLLRMMHLGSLNWLMDNKLIFVSLLAISLWTCGGSIVIMIATLQDVPRSLIEAVEVDGGNAVDRFRYAVFPSISPVVFFQLVMCLVNSLQIYAQSIMLSDNGSPNRMTYFMNVMIYDHAFKQLKMGLACAESWGMFVVVLLITAILFVTKRYWVHEN